VFAFFPFISCSFYEKNNTVGQSGTNKKKKEKNIYMGIAESAWSLWAKKILTGDEGFQQSCYWECST
jgi:hypothetical protein